MQAAFCIYRNLHTGGFSLRHKSRVIERFDPSEVVIFDRGVFARVQEGGRRRTQRTKERNVHAFLCSSHRPISIEGQSPVLSDQKEAIFDLIQRYDFLRVTYAPYSPLSWHYVGTEKPFVAASCAILLGGREVWVSSANKEKPLSSLVMEILR